VDAIDLALRGQNDTDFPGWSDDGAVSEGLAMNDPNATAELDLRNSDMFSRRSALVALGAAVALANAATFASPAQRRLSLNSPKE
jgi:hypothetical protein